MEVPAAVWPVLLFVVCASATAAALLLISAVANPARTNPVKQMPYESGMDPIHDTRRQFHVRFHLLAIAFLVFDVELLFLYPWAVATRPAAAVNVPPVVGSDSLAGSTPGTPLASVPENSGTSRGTKDASPRRLAQAANVQAADVQVVGIDAAVAAGTLPSRDYAFWGAMLFIGLLGLGLVYDWRKGIFQWR